MPKSIKDHYTPLGWARKAVDMLAELCVFEGFVSPGVDDPFELQDFMSRIGFTSVLQQAIQTALIHGCSFLSVVQDFEGRPLIRTHTAESSAAVWDYPNRRVRACMAITDVDDNNEATGLVLYMPDRNISVQRRLGYWWRVDDEQPTIDNECSVFRLAYKATGGQTRSDAPASAGTLWPSSTARTAPSCAPKRMPNSTLSQKSC